MVKPIVLICVFHAYKYKRSPIPFSNTLENQPQDTNNAYDLDAARGVAANALDFNISVSTFQRFNFY